MPDAPVFSLESVNALVPRLNVVIGEQLARRSAIEVKLAELTSLLGTLPEDLDPEPGEEAEAVTLKAEARALILDYRAAWKELEEMGAVVKDARKGLIDFYGRVEGELVWLCWQYGEAEISHYHALEDGFQGRKAILNAVKQRLIN